MQYSDATFKEAVPKPADLEHTGILGPLIRTHVGDTITVVFRNNLTFPVNLDPSGLQNAESQASDSPSGGASPGTLSSTFAAVAQPGQTITYTWVVPQAAGPSPGEADYKMWMYRSSVDPLAHDNAGLIGPLLVGRSEGGAAEALADVQKAGLAPEADQDVIMVFHVMNENESPFLEENLGGRSVEELGLESEEELEESLLKHVVNGFLYCTGPTATMQQGDRVRWHMASVGTEVDLHNAHWHGNTLLQRGHRDDQIKLIPGAVESMVMDADNAGRWWLHCHVNDHIAAGMMVLYEVTPHNFEEIEAAIREELNGTVRRYYVAAEEVMWDYTPQGGEMCSGSLQPFSENALVFVQNATDRIGSTYLKAQFFEYTDGTFTTRKERSAEEAYLGIMGPILRAEVGDTMEVVFLNRVRHPTSMHPHGVRYDKRSEGANYEDGTKGDRIDDDIVATGDRHTYIWQVPETAAPGPSEGSTRLWMYHSHTNEITDTYAGLFGGIVVGRRGALDPTTLRAKDVDRELVLHFSVMDEGQSLLFNENMELFFGGRDEELEGDDDFGESNLMHAINGYLFCNAPRLTFQQGERIRMYVMALGTEVDMHTPNVQSSVFATPQLTHVTAALSMLPGSMHTMDAVAENPGLALLQCRIGDHINAGMSALLSVEPRVAESEGGALLEAAAETRYFIAAEAQEWDYAPKGYDGCTGEAFDEQALVFVERVNGSSIGGRYIKALYRQYTDDTFTELVPQPAENGILGPTIHLEAGQPFQVVFKNRLEFSANLHFDGALTLLHEDRGVNAAVAPGDTFVYSYVIPDSMAPGSDDLSTKAYAYTSSVDAASHPNAGLIGLLLVATPGTLRPAVPGAQQALPEGVDHLVTLLFNVQNENESPYLEWNAAEAGVDQDGVDPDAFEESNLMHCINGFLYCNMPDIVAPANGTTRLVLLGMGSEVDMHSPMFRGQILHSKVTTSNTVELMPTVTRVVDLVDPVEGRWLFYCDVHDHIVAGMKGVLAVE